MKEITITIDDDVYRAASEAAARQRKSLSELVREFLTRLRTEPEPNGSPVTTPESPLTADTATDEELRKRDEELARFFDELNARPLQDGPSVGPLNREELYQRGKQAELTAADEAQRAEFLARLQQLFDQVDEHDASTALTPATPAAEEEAFKRRQEEFAQFFALVKAQRAATQSEDEAKRLALLEQFQPLMEQALVRDRYQKGPLVPLTREEVYAERLDRFR